MAQILGLVSGPISVIAAAFTLAGCAAMPALIAQAPLSAPPGAQLAAAPTAPAPEPLQVTLTVVDAVGAALHSASTAALQGRHTPGTDLVEHTYVETVSRDRGTQQITARPGTFSTGFSYDLMPTVAQGGDVLLQMHLVTVELVEIRTMEWAGLPVQLPVTSTVAVDAVRLFPDGRGETTIDLPRRHLDSGRWSPVRRVRVAVAPALPRQQLVQNAD